MNIEKIQQCRAEERALLKALLPYIASYLSRLYTDHQFAENKIIAKALMDEIETVESIERDILRRFD